MNSILGNLVRSAAMLLSYAAISSAAPPVINIIDPSHGWEKDSIVLHGSNFLTATRVVFDQNRDAVFTVIDDTEIHATVPEFAVTGVVRVINPDGEGSAAFTVVLSEGFQRITSIHLDRDSSALYVTDEPPNEIIRLAIDPSTRQVGRDVIGHMEYPYGIRKDEAGFVYVGNGWFDFTNKGEVNRYEPLSWERFGCVTDNPQCDSTSDQDCAVARSVAVCSSRADKAYLIDKNAGGIQPAGGRIFEISENSCPPNMPMEYGNIQVVADPGGSVFDANCYLYTSSSTLSNTGVITRHDPVTRMRTYVARVGPAMSGYQPAGIDLWDPDLLNDNKVLVAAKGAGKVQIYKTDPTTYTTNLLYNVADGIVPVAVAFGCDGSDGSIIYVAEATRILRYRSPADPVGCGCVHPLNCAQLPCDTTRVATPSPVEPWEYPTIQAAVDASQPGDTVAITEGDWHENVTVASSKSAITITKNPCGNSPTIYPQDTGLPTLHILNTNTISVIGINFRDAETKAILGENVDGLNLTSLDVQFSSGGAVSVAGCTDIQIRSSIFMDNSAPTAYSGSAVAISSSSGGLLFENVYRNNSAPDGSGGAVYVNSVTAFTFDSEHYFGNSGKTGGGLAIANSGQIASPISIRNNTFGQSGDGNAATESGGALSLLNSYVHVELSHINFNGAGAEGGGVIIDSPLGDLTIETTDLRQNTAGINGGAISVQDGVGSGGVVIIKGGVPASAFAIEGNFATLPLYVPGMGLGGGVFSKDSNLRIGDATSPDFDIVFQDNHAEMGGAICIMGTISGNLWENSLNPPGDMCPTSSAEPWVELARAHLLGNVATYGGGGMAVVDGNAPASVCDSTGNGERPTGARATVSDCLFAGNIVEGNDRCHVGTTRGGGLYVSGGQSYGSRVERTTFDGNESRDWRPAPDPNHGDGDGGGASLNNYAQTCFVDCVFSNNTAGDDAGGLDVSVFSYGQSLGGSFEDNTAASNGGGLHGTCSSRWLLKNVAFRRNLASSKHGGGIFFRESELTMIGGAEVKENKAGEYGGGLMFYEIYNTPPENMCQTQVGHLSIQGGYVFESNEAGVDHPGCINCQGKGGAMYIRREEESQGFPSFDISGIIVQDNKADLALGDTGVLLSIFAEGISISGLMERPSAVGPWRGAKIQGTFVNERPYAGPYSAALSVTDSFELDLPDRDNWDYLEIGGGSFEQNNVAVGISNSRVRTANVTGRPQFGGNFGGVWAFDCKDLGDAAFDIRVDASDFRNHANAAVLTSSSDTRISDNTLCNNRYGVQDLGLSDDQDVEITHNDFCISSPPDPTKVSQVGVYLFPMNGNLSNIPLVHFSVHQNDFHGFHDAPWFHGVYLFPGLCPLPTVINAEVNYWGCPNWNTWLRNGQHVFGGPVVDCQISQFFPWAYPPCPDISIVSSGIDFEPWSSVPLY